nr:immunoglobulin heavy chain junction region [Macaca mulatta]MOW87398.1 immunoglobulin heavy chain junction region [Macaca mulatta]MOW89434.1 immunoglobulin heavy chain junction region [Macaca mulatta]MOW93015.1 immunoglobulin heavy chain junction region [Macaca mulatta]MOW93096.1 immunoglobulin heavy chain junction region [Macaca mulatta]
CAREGGATVIPMEVW